MRKKGVLEALAEEDQRILERQATRISITLCRILRHEPELIGVSMENYGGWVLVDELIEKWNARFGKGRCRLNHPILMEIVCQDRKQRYGLRMTPEGLWIRCNQGHSIPWVIMEYRRETPPEVLYHGTAEGYLPSIRSRGLLPMKRQKVHLSVDTATAFTVGRRKRADGAVVILRVDAARMAADGGVFYLSENKIWLADQVPPEYLTIWKGEEDN